MIIAIFMLISIAFGNVFLQLNYDEYGVTAEYSVEPMFIQDGHYTHIYFTDEDGRATEIGKPDMPVIRRFLRIPKDGYAFINIEVIETKRIALPAVGLSPIIFPRQPSRPKIKYIKIDFAFDQRWYNDSVWTIEASNSVKITDEGTIRGRRIGLFEFCPVTFYDPQTGELEYISHARINIRYSSPLEPVEERLRSRVFDELLSQILLVPEDIPEYPELPITYWIIYADEFADTVNLLVQWKNTLGYNVVSTPISSIGATTSQIENAVRNAYNSWEHAPDFVLFVGDALQIPPQEGTAGFGGHPTDLRYFTVDGTDYLPDILYGRMSCATISQVSAIINKTIEYETFSFAETDWLRHVVLPACGDDGFWDIAEGTHRYVINTYIHPPRFAPDTIFARILGDSAGVAMIDAINRGAVVVDYTGHGWEGGWANPPMESSQVYALTNSGKNTIAIGNACLTAKFDEPECFGEAWIRAPQVGAVVYIGGSNSTLWNEDDVWERRWFDAFFSDSFGSVAAATYKALVAVRLSGSTYAEYYFEIYHTLGDPSLWPFWGQVEPITLDFSEWGDVIPITEDILNIPCAVENAIVSIWRPDGRLGVGSVIAGSARITPEFVPETQDTATVVAHKPNFWATTIMKIPNEFLTFCNWRPESLHVGVPETLIVTVLNADSLPLVDAQVSLQGFGTYVEGTTDISGTARLIVNPPFEGYIYLIVVHSGRTMARKPIKCYGAESWNLLSYEAGCPMLILSDTFAVGFPGQVSCQLSLPDYKIYFTGGGTNIDSVIVTGTSATVETPVPLMPLPMTVSFAKHGYVILSDTVPVVNAYGPFSGTIVDTAENPITLVRPWITLLLDGDTVGTIRADYNGNFVLPGNFRCDTYTVVLSSFGYQDTTIDFLLHTRGNYRFAMMPLPSCQLTVNIRDSAGEGICSEVFLFETSRNELVAVGQPTPIEGHFDMGRMPRVPYKLIARSRGFAPLRTEIEPSADPSIFTFTMTQSPDVLIVDLSGAGIGNNIADDLLANGYSTQVVTAFPDTATMWQHNLVLHCAGESSNSATASRLNQLEWFHTSGGRLLFEGGDYAYQVFDQFGTARAQKIMHVSLWSSDEPSGMRFAPLWAESIMTVMPNPLPTTLPASNPSYFDYTWFDNVRPAPDAHLLAHSTLFDTAGTIVIFNDPYRNGFARTISFCCAYNRAFTDTAVAGRVMANLVEYLLPPRHGVGIIYGRVNLQGGGYGDGTEIVATGPQMVAGIAGTEGKFSLELKPGLYNLRFHRPEYYDTTLQETAYLQGRTRVQVTMRSEYVSEMLPKNLVFGKPFPNPFNSTIAIPYEAPTQTTLYFSVRDIAGKTIHQETMSIIGRGRIIWQTDKASGLYLLEISTGDNVKIVEKALFIK